jgi:uncharacterized protein (DUF3820 family)
VCSDCQRHIKFNPKPWTLERASEFRLPFGKHRGRRLHDLASSQGGRDYLHWLSENVDGNAGMAAEIVLQGRVK